MSTETTFKSDEQLQTASYNDAIEYILSRFHQRHREQLEALIPLAEKLENRHGEREDCPIGIAEALQQAYSDLSQHMMKEERVLFPMIQAGNYVMARMPIQMMEFEHEEHGNTLELLLSLTNNLTPPADACTTWQTLYQGIGEFITDLRQHIHTENDILFARVVAE